MVRCEGVGRNRIWRNLHVLYKPSSVCTYTGSLLHVHISNCVVHGTI